MEQKKINNEYPKMCAILIYGNLNIIEDKYKNSLTNLIDNNLKPINMDIYLSTNKLSNENLNKHKEIYNPLDYDNKKILYDKSYKINKDIYIDFIHKKRLIKLLFKNMIKFNIKYDIIITVNINLLINKLKIKFPSKNTLYSSSINNNNFYYCDLNTTYLINNIIDNINIIIATNKDMEINKENLNKSNILFNYIKFKKIKLNYNII